MTLLTAVVIRRASREDIEKFSDMTGKPTLKAWVGELNDEIIALGGFAIYRGRWVMFLDLSPQARQFKFALVRFARHLMTEAKAEGVKFIRAEADVSEPMSRKWLCSLGFEPEPNSNLYIWRNPQT